MEIEKLIDQLRTESLYKDKATLDIMDLCMDAALALEQLQAENEKLKAQVPRWIPVEERLPEVQWFRWPGVKRELLEAPCWYGEARDKYGAKIVEEMVPDKTYLYQLYSTCFLEFDSLDAAKSYYDEGKREDPYFDIDPVTIIDTHDPEVRERWKGHMKEEEVNHD